MANRLTIGNIFCFLFIFFFFNIKKPPKHNFRMEEIEIIRKNSFTFIDLFAGIGGLRLAFEAAGGKCIFSSEIDRFARETYMHIFNEEPYGDIKAIKAADIPPHDILAAGFPCQPFSLAGVSKYESLGYSHGFRHSTKGTLFFDIARILEHHKPEAFLLENVKNLLSHNNGRTWDIIEKTLSKELNYHVSYKVLDAQSLVPQHRERVFIVGFKNKVAFSWPDIKYKPRTLKEILDDAPSDKYTLSDHLWGYLQEYSEKHRRLGNGFGYGLADFNGITRTLSARYHKDGSEILIPQNGKNPRRLTPAECARLMGFPEIYWTPVVSDTQAYRQFGNAVVVPLATLIAKEVAFALYSGNTDLSRHRTISGEVSNVS